MALFRAQIPQPVQAVQPVHLTTGVPIQALWQAPSGPAALKELEDAARAGTPMDVDLTPTPPAEGAEDKADGGGDGGGGEGGGGSEKKKVAASDTDKSTAPQAKATGLALLMFVVGVVGAVVVFHTSWGPTYTPAEGIGVFALFYIVAQAVERFVEMTMPAFEKADSFNKSRKKVELDRALETFYAAAGSRTGTTSVTKDGTTTEKTADDAAKDAANKQAEIDQLRANRTVIMFGLSAALGMVLCGYLEADFLTSVGANFGTDPDMWQQALMMAVTGLIVGGGSKQLHDLITNVSKAKEDKATPTETGGQK